MKKLLTSSTILLSCVFAALHSFAAPDYVPEDGSAAEKKTANVQGWVVDPDPKLPNVLIIGDSISIGYGQPLRVMLAGKANVFRPMAKNGKNPENCQGTTSGVANVDRWMRGQKWDVIHFNFGLHDLKHVDAKTGQASNSFDDPYQADPKTYGENLEKIVKKLQKSGAKLIYATTTPYPAGVAPARLPADAKLYNDIAIKIMKAKNIEVNDLYSEVKPMLKKYQLPKNVHFNKEGSEAMAAKVASVIETKLP
jgi:acyl-CoA thioesterase-1